MAHSSLRGRLLASAMLALTVPTIAAAQTASTPPPTDSAAPSVPAADAGEGAATAQAPATAATARPAEARGDEIVVTGSRIARPEFAAPNPITSFNAAAIQESGNTNITTFLERVPALTGSLDFTQTSGGNAVYAQPFGQAGLNELNLRNLGTNRTLVLVDGRRHVAGSSFSAAVDINSIPTDLIQRVDVLTAGASAVYGADGVSGVVNFVLKRDLEGLTARTQQGISSRGDAANHFVSIAEGHNFAGGRGNVTVAYEFNADDPLANDDRRYLRFDRRQYLIPNDAAASDPSAPHNILVGNLRYGGESPIGAVFVGDEGSPSFNGFGQPYRAGTPVAYYTTGANSDDTPVAGFYSGDLAPRVRRHDVNLLTHYDFSDAFKLSFDGKFAQTDARTFDFFNAIYYTPIALDNPYIPQSIRDAAAAAGTDQIHVNRDNLDYGRHGEDDRRRTYRGVLDASGRISGHATYDAYFEYGRTDTRITKINETLSTNYLQAIDAVTNPTTGQIVCRSTLTDPGNGCLPVNLFGATPTSRQALGYFQINDVSHSRVSQQVANLSVSGDFGQFFSLPGGPIQFSFGGEYRRESSLFEPSENLQNGAFLSYNEPAQAAVSGGHFNVKEAFGELNAPILKDKPFASILSVGAAYRFSSYSTIGSTNTWQANGVYAPVRDLTFRGSYGKAVRAPNIQELFQPTSGVNNFITDPCSLQEIGNGPVGTNYRVDNCHTLLARYGVSYTNPADAAKIAALQTGSNINGITSGNRNLRPESARTWTAGVVLRPRWLRGLTASVDWYDINLKNAINTAAPGALPGLCVDQPTLDNPFCAAVTRQQGTGRVVSYVTQPENVASFRTAGADLNLDYLLRTDRAGVFDLRLIGGYLHRLTVISLPGAPLTDNLDQFNAPRWTFNFSPTWTIGGLSVNYNLRWFDRTRTQPKQTTDADPDYAPAAQLRYHALWQHDVQVQYLLKSGFAVYAGVNNLTDQKPDRGNSINAPISALGRYLYVGAKLNLSRR